ncbi:hypothetical protein [Salidesulfovibrio onnuriiensis]|uniref:hypothetical protein n=1 Tax=Salidesulfovibrio onnuriiensis TaxID=2583823 RepID=UPI0011CB8143|nr:hypothetical protein [Salidesulfovibrio onnuriiensis]
MKTADGYSYILFAHLTKRGGSRLKRLLEESDRPTQPEREMPFRRKSFDLNANGSRIVSDNPPWDTFRQDYASMMFKDKQGAFAAANALCPPKSPPQILEDGDPKAFRCGN